MPPKCNPNLHHTFQFVRYLSKAKTPSPTALGTAYEHLLTRTLRPLGISVTRIGGANDCGIDLVGTWNLPAPISAPGVPPRPPHHDANGASNNDIRAQQPRVVRIPVFIQAKRTTLCRPSLVREVEGAFPALGRALMIARAEDPAVEVPSAPVTADGGGVEDDDVMYGPVSKEVAWHRGAIGVLATTAPATKGVREALGRSRVPLGFVQVVPRALEMASGEIMEGEGGGDVTDQSQRSLSTGRINQILWNTHAGGETVGGGALGRCGVGLRYFDNASIDSTARIAHAGGESRMEKEAVITVNGDVWEPFGMDGKDGAQDLGEERSNEGLC